MLKKKKFSGVEKRMLKRKILTKYVEVSYKEEKNKPHCMLTVSVRCTELQ